MVCFDAKINFDDNASFRQEAIFAMHDPAEDDPREVAAAKFNLNYVGMDGEIGCLGAFSSWPLHRARSYSRRADSERCRSRDGHHGHYQAVR